MAASIGGIDGVGDSLNPVIWRALAPPVGSGRPVARIPLAPTEAAPSTTPSTTPDTELLRHAVSTASVTVTVVQAADNAASRIADQLRRMREHAETAQTLTADGPGYARQHAQFLAAAVAADKEARDAAFDGVALLDGTFTPTALAPAGTPVARDLARFAGIDLTVAGLLPAWRPADGIPGTSQLDAALRQVAAARGAFAMTRTAVSRQLSSTWDEAGTTTLTRPDAAAVAQALRTSSSSGLHDHGRVAAAAARLLLGGS